MNSEFDAQSASTKNQQKATTDPSVGANSGSTSAAAPHDALDFDEISELFLAEYRQGKNPSVDDYANRYPKFRDEILELLPTITLLEKGGSSESLASFSQCVGRKGLEPTDLKQLKNFKILREIGRGGMGVVYEAWDENLDRVVALKVMKIFPGEEEQTIRRFQREAKMAAKLHHTNIVPVYGSDAVDDHFFYAMQLIRGISLESFLKQRERQLKIAQASTGTRADKDADQREASGSANEELDLDATLASNVDPDQFFSQIAGSSGAGRRDPHVAAEALRDTLSASEAAFMSAQFESPLYCRRVAELGLQASRALEYAARHGVVHRDIKPSNLIVDSDDTLWITDFGLAKPIEEKDLTRQGQLVGTLRYLAPEALEGRFSPLSDVYSLGLTLYEMLTYTPAFDETSYPKLLAQVAHAEPIRPKKLNAKIPRDLETIILKAIERSPERRYSAAEMADDLQRFLEERPILARRIGFFERAWRWCKRNKLVASLAATVACLLFAVFVVMSCSYFDMKTLMREKNAESQRAQENLSLALAAFDELFETLVSGSDDSPVNLFDETAAYNLSTNAEAITEKDAQALDKMLDFYVGYVNANKKNEKDPTLTYHSARAFFRTGVIRKTLGSGGDFDAFNQAFAFYEKSLNALNPDESCDAIAREMAQLAVVLYDAAPPNANEDELNHKCEVALQTLARVDSSRRDASFDQLVVKARLARAARSIFQIRRRDGAESRGLYAPYDLPVPTAEERARVESDLAVLAQYSSLHERSKDPQSVRIIGRYYALKALWLSALRDHRGAQACVANAKRNVRALQKLLPNDQYSYAVSLSVEFVNARVVFEKALETRESDSKREFEEIVAAALAIGDDLVAKNPNSSFNALGQIIVRLYFAQMLALQGESDQVEALLTTADVKLREFVERRPNFNVSFARNKLNALCAEFYAHEKRFDEARARLDAIKAAIATVEQNPSKNPKANDAERLESMRKTVERIESVIEREKDDK